MFKRRRTERASTDDPSPPGGEDPHGAQYTDPFVREQVIFAEEMTHGSG